MSIQVITFRNEVSEFHNNCNHEKVSEGTCMNCGLIVDSIDAGEATFSRKISRKTSAPVSIYNEMESYNIPDIVKRKADEIYQNIRNEAEKKGGNLCKRSGQRDKLKYYCLYEAYEQLGIIIDPRSLAIIVGLKHGKMSSAISEYTPPGTKRKPKTPIDFISVYHQLFNLPIGVENDIKNLTNRIVDKEPSLLEEPLPQNIAIAIISYYMKTRFNGFKINLNSEIGISEMTISNLQKRIERIDNS